MLVSLAERIVGRFSADDVFDPLNPTKTIVDAGELITEEMAARIDELGIERVKVMSPLTSITKGGIDAANSRLSPYPSVYAPSVVPGAGPSRLDAELTPERFHRLYGRVFAAGGSTTTSGWCPMTSKRPGMVTCATKASATRLMVAWLTKPPYSAASSR